MEKRTIRRRRFKRVIPFDRADAERIISVQLDLLDSTKADVIFKQGCLNLKRTIIGTPEEITSIYSRANV